MNRTNKIIISVIGGLIVMISLICVYGFTIGGDNAFSAIFLVFSSLIISALAFTFVFGKNFIKSDKLRNIALVVAFVAFIISFFTYGGLNRISADESKTVEYEAEITYFSDGFRGSDTIYFVNSQGFEVNIAYIGEIISFEETMLPEEAEIICIREIQGGFGYPIYEVLGFK